MMIMGHEVQDLDFLDADVLEKVENASKRVVAECEKARKAKRESEGVRIQCNAIAEFIDEIFGTGTAKILIKSGANLFTCISVYSEVMKSIGESKAEQNNKISSIMAKYSPERSKKK